MVELSEPQKNDDVTKVTAELLRELLNSGWERRTIMDEPRLSELVELYESLNLEVRLVPLTLETLEILGEVCEACYTGNWDNYKIIFTRPYNK